MCAFFPFSLLPAACCWLSCQCVWLDQLSSTLSSSGSFPQLCSTTPQPHSCGMMSSWSASWTLSQAQLDLRWPYGLCLWNLLIYCVSPWAHLSQLTMSIITFMASLEQWLLQCRRVYAHQCTLFLRASMLHMPRVKILCRKLSVSFNQTWSSHTHVQYISWI